MAKLYNWTEHLLNLGINAIYFGPLFESVSHGYDTADYYHIDRRLGSKEDFAALFSHLHSKGIKIIVDGVFNHVGRNFWAFRDVLEHKENSRFCSWFKNLNFNGRSPFNDPFTYEGWENHYNLVKLNLDNCEVEQHLLGAVRMWIEELGIDGIRLDAADCVDLNFQKKLSSFTKQLKSDFFLLGEIIHGDYNLWANSSTLDSVTNYECYKGLYSSHNDKNYFEIAYALNRQFGEYGIYKQLPLYSFVDNHDVNRLASTLKDKNNLLLTYSLMMTMPGVPSIYYGSEAGIEGIKSNGSDDQLRPCLDLDNMYNNGGNGLIQGIKKLAEIRKNSPALKYGTYRQLLVKSEQFAFEREHNGNRIIAVFNSSGSNIDININTGGNNGEYKDIFNGGHISHCSNGNLHIDNLPPHSVKILGLN
jgi:glycosidase